MSALTATDDATALARAANKAWIFKRFYDRDVDRLIQYQKK